MDRDEVEVHKHAKKIVIGYRSGSQSQREIRFILPARGASHKIKIVIRVDFVGILYHLLINSKLNNLSIVCVNAMTSALLYL